jgi:hypothetical protein
MDKFSPEIIALLNTMYRHGSDRRTALKTLFAMKTADSTAALLRLAQDYRVPPFYVDILHELGERGALDPMHYFRDILLTESDVSTHTSNQLTVIIKLGEYGHRSSTFSLLTHLLKKHNNRHILRQCVYTLGQIGNDDAVYILSLLMNDYHSASVRHDAIMVLGSTGNALAVNVLLNYLEFDHTLSEDGQPSSDCVNAMSSLVRLWNAEVQPFDVGRCLQVLTYWLYQDVTEYPKALYALKKIETPQAKVIIEQWEQTRRYELTDKFFF